MKFANRVVIFFAFLTLLLLWAPIMAFAVVPIKGSSQNGENTNAANWNLLGRTKVIPVSGNGKQATLKREVVCPNQDVENSLPAPIPLRTGGCDSGAYLFIFQLQSSSNNVTVRISNLVNFTLDANVPNYGVMICDNSDPHNGNTAELCTNDPTGTHIPDITVTADANKTALNFLVPNTFPIYPAGVGGQGQGLTFFIVVQQSTALSIQFPSVSIR